MTCLCRRQMTQGLHTKRDFEHINRAPIKEVAFRRGSTNDNDFFSVSSKRNCEQGSDVKPTTRGVLSAHFVTNEVAVPWVSGLDAPPFSPCAFI